jgi:UDP-N-acetylmuramate: L-alanyl-gamma-D-glutamyl-meso-diaminopimelate ligase
VHFNDFIVLEVMNIYLLQLIEDQKISLYQPNIALLSGTWDHINVFPTFDNYIGTV